MKLQMIPGMQILVSDMIFAVELYISQRKGVSVNITFPSTPRQVSLLVDAYIIAINYYKTQ